MATFIFDVGISHDGWRACEELRMRVSMSAMGSLMLMPRPYQLAFVMPGISPARARRRKQMRHSAKRLMKARGRPHKRQRLWPWTLKRGGRCALAIMDFFANFFGLLCEVQPWAGLPFSTDEKSILYVASQELSAFSSEPSARSGRKAKTDS